MRITRDRRLGSIRWRDLLKVSTSERIHELLLSLPWLILTLALFHIDWYLPALIASFFLFLTGLRQVHDAFHYTMGFPRWVCELMIFALSLLMLSAMHAIQVTHLHHHRNFPDDDDIEAATAKMSGPRALLYGPIHPLRLHLWGFRLASIEKRTWIVVELAAILLYAILAFLVLDIHALKCHIVAMAIGQCLTGFFCVWTVHHGYDQRQIITRTQRGFLKNLASYNMFYHLEHHLFPTVPTCHLRQLAQRLDQVAPELRSNDVY